MKNSQSSPTLRPLAMIVCLVTLAASSLLVSAARVGSPTSSGYGVNEDTQLRSIVASQE